MAEFARAWANPSGQRRWKLGVDGGGLALAGVSGQWEGCRAPLADSDGRRGAIVSVDEEVGTERERGEVERERTGSW